MSYEHKNIKITTALDLKMTVKTDFEILTIIVRNLISNAIKFTPKNGSISITSAPYELIISDSGVGISPEILEKIRNQDSLSSMGTDNERGSGIGLQLVFNLAEKINCILKIDSEESKGTCVRIIFKN